MNHTKLVCLLMTFVSPCIALSWQEILHNKTFLDASACQLLSRQQELYAKGQAPVVAAPEIKAIPIVECEEPLVDISTMGNARITMLPNPTDHKPFFSPACNSGLPNAAKIRKGVWEKLREMVCHLDDLAPDFGYARGQISIKVFEGVRDIQTYMLLFNNKVAEIQAQNPALTYEQAEAEACTWVSPYKNNVPVQSTGAAVDIRLWDEYAQNFVDVGPFGVIWGANKTGQTFFEDISDAQKLNRLYLLLAATKAGLVNYVYEYWHLSSGDRYAIYWQEQDTGKRVARYGPV